MMWFTENPWPGVIIMVGIASLLLWKATNSGLLKYWGGVAICLLLATTAFYVEQSIVTPAEEIEAEIYDTLAACQSGQTADVVEKISPREVVLRGVVFSGMALAKIHEDVHISDVQIQMLAENSRSISHFRANGTISTKNQSYSNHAATRWELTWQKEAGAWKIVAIKRLHPINGNEMAVLDQSGT